MITLFHIGKTHWTLEKKIILWNESLYCQVDKKEGGYTFPQASLLPVPQDPTFQGGARISRNTISYKSIKTKKYKLKITDQLQRNSNKGIQITNNKSITNRFKQRNHWTAVLMTN